MSPIPPVSGVNRLLAAPPRSDQRRMLAAGETVAIAFAEELYAPGARISHVCFPTHGFISLVMPVDASASLEVGLVGNEGMFGVPLALGVAESPVRAVVQGASRCAWAPRISRASSREAARYSPD